MSPLPTRCQGHYRSVCVCVCLSPRLKQLLLACLFFFTDLLINAATTNQTMVLKEILIILLYFSWDSNPGIHLCAGFPDPGKTVYYLGQTRTACNEVGGKHVIFMRHTLPDLDMTFNPLVGIPVLDLPGARGSICKTYEQSCREPIKYGLRATKYKIILIEEKYSFCCSVQDREDRL